MNPDWLTKLLHYLETADGSTPVDRPNIAQAKPGTVGAADRGNIPVPDEILKALPAKRTTKIDKVIGAASDLSPVGGAESIARAYHLGRGGDQAGATRALIDAGLQLAPYAKGGSIAAEAEPFWHESHLPSAAADSAVASTARAAVRGHPEIQGLLKEMQSSSGSPNLPRITSIDPAKGKQLAQAYESLPVNDPNARASYDALNREVAAQKQRLQDAGFKFEMVDHDPYPNSKAMMADVAQNRRLQVYKTSADQAHPYMTADQNNDFRAVHDLLAHAGEGHQFGPVGEENAYRVHASTLSPDALPALASETRGQNSYVNFGPNAHLPVAERGFAPQKAALFPQHLTGDYDKMAASDALPAKYAILTGENPGGVPATPERNAQHNLALEKLLTQQGLKFEKAKGAPTDDATGNLLTENSYIVHGVEPSHAERIGRQVGQNGVVTHLGYHDLAGNKLHPSSGLTFADEQPYTELPDGRRVRSEIDWSKNNPLASAEAMGDSASFNAVKRFKDTAADIRAFPDQRRQDMIDALRGEPYMRPEPFASPAVVTRNRWKPTSRGVFDRTPGSELVRDPQPLPFEAKAKPKSTGLHPAAERIANDPAVEKRIMSDVEKGRDQGGIGWYGLAPVRDAVEEAGGNFRDFNMAGAAGSARTPTHNELTNMSLNLFGRANGKTAEEARQAFLERFPDSMRPTYMGMHRDIYDRGVARGVMGPNNPADGALKIPHYFHNRMLGANGVPIDAHEMMMMSQATGISRDEIKAAMAAGGNNYEAMTAPYHRVAEKLGMTPDQVQASRWLGGGLQTGLKSQPQGDFMQTLEDGLLYTARTQGLSNPESATTLKDLFGRIVKGQDFFMPYKGDGGFPVY